MHVREQGSTKEILELCRFLTLCACALQRDGIDLFTPNLAGLPCH